VRSTEDTFFNIKVAAHVQNASLFVYVGIIITMVMMLVSMMIMVIMVIMARRSCGEDPASGSQ
jgi:heme/copper-type cytochrome/quinol oxidase subunit 2